MVPKCQFHILTNRVDIIYICWGIYIIIIFHKITVTYIYTLVVVVFLLHALLWLVIVLRAMVVNKVITEKVEGHIM